MPARAILKSAVSVALVTLTLAGLVPCAARADEPILLGVEGALVVPVTSPTLDRFGVGGTLGVSGSFAVNEWLIPVLRLRAMLLSDGAPPADATLRDPGVGTSFGLTVGLRLRANASLAPGEAQRADGLWFEIDAGGVLTGDLARPAFEVGIGYGFEIDDVKLGPALRFQHVLHFDDPLDSNSAHLLTIGAELVLFDAHPRAIAEEEPGLPRGDRDHDGIGDDIDACPDDSEDVDGFEDEEGCPDPDNDRDGILDLDDACPMQPEDLDRWEDEDGCPDPDNDGDAVFDPDDACPNEPETLNGVADDDGCPDEGLIQMIEDRIVIEERVLFDFERARVKHSARPVLQAIVGLWRQHPEWTRVRVEGHADARGDAAFNQELSERRAARVRDVLVDLGMPIDMIEVAGFGSSMPRDTRTLEVAHQRNRRVEFVVVARRASTGGTEGSSR